MEFLLYLAMVLFVLFAFLIYPIIAILRSDFYTGWAKFYAFLVVLGLSWIGYVILQYAAKK